MKTAAGTSSPFIAPNSACSGCAGCSGPRAPATTSTWPPSRPGSSAKQKRPRQSPRSASRAGTVVAEPTPDGGHKFKQLRGFERSLRAGGRFTTCLCGRR